MPSTAKNKAITVRGLGKAYTLVREAHRPTTMAETLLQRLRDPFRRPERESFWAIKDVSFELYRGDVVGIIGRNGAGKSTLLKLLSRITEPSAGQIDLYGRVGSLLEVGTGFHPELTGRENIYLNGAILGMTHREIDRQFDAIVDFAEVERFLDTPVKRYSSGMYARLAFAVAAYLDPEILIVDEVLAVGDAQFQKKCLGKMKSVAQEGGRTVLFVSHSMASVRALCNRGLMLKQGTVVFDGDIDSAIEAYVREGENSMSLVTWEPESPQREVARLRRAYVLDADGRIPVTLECDQPFSVVAEVEVHSPVTNLRVGFVLQTPEGIVVCGCNEPEWSGKTRQTGLYQCQWTFPAYSLNQGTFLLSFRVDIPNDRAVHETQAELSFVMNDVIGYGSTAERFHGLLRPRLEWSEQYSSTAENKLPTLSETRQFATGPV
jgi:lipopolysaccharide transport system ATP-binding protein